METRKHDTNGHPPNLPDSGGETTGKVIFFEEEKRRNFLTGYHNRLLLTLKNSYGEKAVHTALQTGRKIIQETGSFIKACNVGYIDLLNATNGVEQSLSDRRDFNEILSMYKDFMGKQIREQNNLKQEYDSDKQEAKIVQILDAKDNNKYPHDTESDTLEGNPRRSQRSAREDS